MKTKIIIVLALLAAVLAGCNKMKDVFVPGVPEVYWDYFPYAVGDSLIFSNGLKDMAFEVSEVFIEKEDAVIENVVPYGSSQMGFGTQFNDSLLAISGYISVPNHLESAEFKLSFAEQSTLDRERAKRGYTFGTTYYYVPQDMVFTGASLYLAKGVIGEEAPAYEIEYASLVKGRGVTMFFDAKSNTEWKLKEIRKKYEKQ